MLFNSYIFILLFLPLTLVGYFSFNHLKLYRIASVFLLLMSLWFYAYFNISYLPLILASIAVNYTVYRILLRDMTGAVRKCALALALVFNLGLLIYYKYLGFFAENINALFSSDITVRKLILPLGISFFTFQQISFVIDSYKREVQKYSLLDYALFVSYFPQLIAGPIVTHDELVPQLGDISRKKVNFDNMSRGLYLFVLGLSKKVLLADVFGICANYGFSNIGALTSPDAVVVMLSYTLQIYFDFSGYCDMASGIAKMMNIDLPENFISPYKADSIGAFWRGWHITLTRFFTKYIYIPMGGSKRGGVCTCVNIMLVFLVSGIWHGAAWTFVLWGVCHGVLSVLGKIAERPLKVIPKPLCVTATFALVNLTWVLFRAESIGDALAFYQRLFDLDSTRLSGAVRDCFEIPEFTLIFTKLTDLIPQARAPLACMILLFAVSFVIVFFTKTARERAKSFKMNYLQLLFMCILFVWALVSLSGMSTFLYFNF